MGRNDNRVHPDRLIARSRQWSKAAVASAGAATLGLTGWIAISTQTASASTNPIAHKTHTSKPTTSSQSSDDSSSDDSSSSTTSGSTSSGGSSSTPSSTPTQSPQVSNSSTGSGSSPVQGTTRAS